LDLAAQGGTTAGPIVMPRPAQVRFRDRTTSIAASGGRLAWNDRDLTLQALALTAAEGTVRIDARIDELLGTPRVDATLAADANLEAVSPWIGLEHALPGTAHVDAHLTGTGVELTTLRAQLANGEIGGTGRTAFDGGGTARLTWQRVDVQALLSRLVPNPPRVLPAAAAPGSPAARWARPRLA